MDAKAFNGQKKLNHNQNLHHINPRELVSEIIGEQIAGDILASSWPNNIMQLVYMSEEEIALALGLPSEAARRLAASFELHRRIVEWSVPVRPVINDPAEAIKVLAPMNTLPEEHFYCLPLNARCQLICAPIEVGHGDVDACDAGPRAFFRAALRCGAVQAIAAHNHPTGDPTPSAADRAVTQRLVAAGRALDIQLVDHVIVTPERDRWCSLRRDAPECFR